MDEIKIPHHPSSGLLHMNYVWIISSGRNSWIHLLIRQIQARRTKMEWNMWEVLAWYGCGWQVFLLALCLMPFPPTVVISCLKGLCATLIRDSPCEIILSRQWWGWKPNLVVSLLLAKPPYSKMSPPNLNFCKYFAAPSFSGLSSSACIGNIMIIWALPQGRSR